MPLNCMRSLLFVPATSTHLLAKAAQRGADALIIDLEDAVPVARKREARVLAADAIATLAGALPLLLRVNADPDLWQADLQAVPLHRLHGVMLPKVESPAQVRLLQAALDQRCGSSEANPGSPPPIIALIETPLGVLRAEQIAEASPNLRALGFGAEDFAAEMGVAPLPAALQWPAHKVAVCARAFGLACWGLPGSVAEIADMAAFDRLVAQARAIGFTGTVCIHPRQVPVAIAGFGPSPQELQWARDVVAAADAAQAQGAGAVQLDGRMVDRPVVERARRWLAMAAGRH